MLCIDVCLIHESALMPASDTAKCTCSDTVSNVYARADQQYSALWLFARRIQVMLQDRTGQDKTRQDKTRQDKTRQGKARQDKTSFKSEEQTHTVRLCGETRRQRDLIGKQPLHQHIQMLLRLDIYELPEWPVVICSLLSQAYKSRTECMGL